MKVKASLDKNILTVFFSEIKESDKSQEASIGMELLKKLGSYDSAEHKKTGCGGKDGGCINSLACQRADECISEISSWTITRERSGSQHLYLAQQVLRTFCI